MLHVVVLVKHLKYHLSNSTLSQGIHNAAVKL
jgi:hypothetical protein